uniref:Uncharacterized protein n=1 Tax=Rhizophora mucronata TaxID=61149 RepID=A0A2P2QQ03_RHIMU
MCYELIVVTDSYSLCCLSKIVTLYLFISPPTHISLYFLMTSWL